MNSANLFCTLVLQLVYNLLLFFVISMGIPTTKPTLSWSYYQVEVQERVSYIIFQMLPSMIVGSKPGLILIKISYW